MQFFRMVKRAFVFVSAVTAFVWVMNRDQGHPNFAAEKAEKQPKINLGIAYAQGKLPRVDWKLLRGLNYRTGEVAADLKKFDGQQVRIPGYMVPLDDESEKVSEFLLVPYVGACIHTPPPPPNQIVLVTMEASRKVSVSFWDPFWANGKLEISKSKSPYGDVSFRLKAQKLDPYTEE